LIEDVFGKVLCVKQSGGKRLWTLPGGKVRAKESLEHALRREIMEEIGAKVLSFTLLDLYDRPEKSAVGVLYRVSLLPGKFKPQSPEIERIAFRATLPGNATPSAKYFWRWAHRHNA
jgi:ADP-ribose pyrophosphatase YjhB (NUDIX family)